MKISISHNAYEDMMREGLIEIMMSYKIFKSIEWIIVDSETQEQTKCRAVSMKRLNNIKCIVEMVVMNDEETWTSMAR